VHAASGSSLNHGNSGCSCGISIDCSPIHKKDNNEEVYHSQCFEQGLAGSPSPSKVSSGTIDCLDCHYKRDRHQRVANIDEPLSGSPSPSKVSSGTIDCLDCHYKRDKHQRVANIDEPYFCDHTNGGTPIKSAAVSTRRNPPRDLIRTQERGGVTVGNFQSSFHICPRIHKSSRELACVEQRMIRNLHGRPPICQQRPSGCRSLADKNSISSHGSSVMQKFFREL
jgi:hypothetical protein